LDSEKGENKNPNNKNSADFDYDRFIEEEKSVNSKELSYAAVSREKSNTVQSSSGSEIYDWMQSLVSALLICVLVFAFFVRIIGIIGSSMVPTFHDKDSVIISNILYEPKQGDVIVLRKLAFEEEPIIKRVIAVAGQTVNIDFEKGIVYVDGIALDEPYIAETTFNALDFDGEITVPENCVFVMGDNRNNSTDSRRSVIGCVDKRYILGKVLLRILPIDKFGVIN